MCKELLSFSKIHTDVKILNERRMEEFANEQRNLIRVQLPEHLRDVRLINNMINSPNYAINPVYFNNQIEQALRPFIQQERNFALR
jgi:hypothetical protein